VGLVSTVGMFASLVVRKTNEAMRNGGMISGTGIELFDLKLIRKKTLPGS
jgi:hypothetical protein